MTIGRGLLALLFIGAGVMHFVFPRAYVGIMPAMLPAPLLLVQVSGVAEILGGVGLLIPLTRTLAAWGLVALLIAVLPANLNMAIHPGQFASTPVWVLWARIPLQLPLIWWAWLYTRR